MTKIVRIENADTSDYKVIVNVWEKTETGDVLVKTVELGYPTAMTGADVYLTSSRYIEIREAEKQT